MIYDSELGRNFNNKIEQVLYWRKLAHEYFDQVWTTGKYKGYRGGRDMAYQELARDMGLPYDYTHMSMFDKWQCKKVIEWSKKRRVAKWRKFANGRKKFKNNKPFIQGVGGMDDKSRLQSSFYVGVRKYG